MSNILILIGTFIAIWLPSVYLFQIVIGSDDRALNKVLINSIIESTAITMIVAGLIL